MQISIEPVFYGGIRKQFALTGFIAVLMIYHNTKENKTVSHIFTGNFHTFVNVVSARTAVGHDAEGRLILFHFDGQTGVRG